MNRTFASEDDRKTKLFISLIDWFVKFHADFNPGKYTEVYEGMATVKEASKNRLGFYLEGGVSRRHIPVSPEISEHCAPLDMMFVVLGKRDDRWWLLDVISIGSFIDVGRMKDAHLTINPLHKELAEAPPQALH